MLPDLIARLFRDRGDQGIEIIALEESHLTTTLAEQEVLVRLACGDKCLAALGLVYPLDEVQFLQFFQSAIDGDQTEGGILRTRDVEYLDRGEGPLGRGNGFHHRASSFG